MFDPTTIFLSSLFSLFGVAFWVYGKRQSDFPFLAAGALLIVYPFFVTGTMLLLLFGIILIAVPFVARHMGI